MNIDVFAINESGYSNKFIEIQIIRKYVWIICGIINSY